MISPLACLSRLGWHEADRCVCFEGQGRYGRATPSERDRPCDRRRSRPRRDLRHAGTAFAHCAGSAASNLQRYAQRSESDGLLQNFTGFVKIMKKHDKKSGLCVSPWFLARLVGESFYKVLRRSAARASLTPTLSRARVHARLDGILVAPSDTRLATYTQRGTSHATRNMGRVIAYAVLCRSISTTS